MASLTKVTENRRKAKAAKRTVRRNKKVRANARKTAKKGK